MRNSHPVQKLRLDPYDFFILALTVLFFLSLLVLALPYFDSATQQIALWLDLMLSLIFMVDFLYTLITAADKRAYLKWGWIDFLGSLPYLPLMRVLRIFRAVRSLRIMRQNNLQDIFDEIKRRPERSTFFTVALFSIILVCVSSYAVLHTEQLSPTSNIQTASDAFWWAVVTITTVGYGDRFPTTNGGRVIAIALMLMGISIFSVLTSYISAIFLNQDYRSAKAQNEDMIWRLTAIEQQLQDLTEIIEELSEED